MKKVICLTSALLVSLTGCADDPATTPDPSYHTGPGSLTTVYGEKQPAPADAGVVGQRPDRDQGEGDSNSSSEVQHRSYYRHPSDDEVDERTAILMRMNEQIRARVKTANEKTPASHSDKAPSASDGASARPLPSMPIVQSKPSEDQKPQASYAKADGGALPDGRYQVYLDFDSEIPLDALQALLGLDTRSFVSREIGAGNRRVYLGGYQSKAQAESRQQSLESSTGLSPVISTQSG